MAAIGPFTIPDGKTTPANHTFNPVQSQPPLYKENGDDTVPVVGENSVTLKFVPSKGSSTVNKALVTLSMPILETPSGGTPSGYVAPPAVAYTLRGKCEFILPNRSTGEQRRDLRVLLENIITAGALVGLVDELEMPY